MEMKADIAGAVTDTMFHKIYIQRYENVRSAIIYNLFIYLEFAIVFVHLLTPCLRKKRANLILLCLSQYNTIQYNTIRG